MSRPKYYWYGIVKKMIMELPDMNDGSLQTAIMKNAYVSALEETLHMPNGELRMKAIREILIEKTKTYQGVGMEIGYEWHTVQNWIRSFVNMVGKKAGF